MYGKENGMTTGDRKRKVAKKPETILSDAIRDALAREPGLLMFRNSVGTFRARGFVVKAGLPKGSADMIGILAIDSPRTHDENGILSRPEKLGRFVAIEVKQPGEEPRALDVLEAMHRRKPLEGKALHELEQQRWMQAIRDLGGFASFASSVEGATAAIGRARRGERL